MVAEWMGGQVRLMKKVILVGFVLLAAAGMYAALRNLPVITGCDFYADCRILP
jgi:TRAP-type mannitol/chloroaromatic compound transport system permease small subunit